jgi:hypothetical protein
VLRWHEAAGADLVAQVAGGRLDVAVVYSARAGDGVALLPFFEDDLVARLPCDGSWDAGTSVSAAELEGLIVLLGGSAAEGHDQRCLALLREAGVEPRTATHPYGATGVPRGHVALTSRVLVGPAGRYATLEPRHAVRFSFAVREHGPSPEVEAFADQARAVAAARGWGRRTRRAVAALSRS